MIKYNCLNPIAAVGLDLFTDEYEKKDSVENADAILVRSANMLEMELPDDLKVIARAGAGVNNIPIDKCSEKGIVVFNTPGANANAVKELVITGLMLASRNVVGGINWVQTIKEDENVAKLVEKGKSQFAGNEIYGKKLGVIGLGAIGVLVANAAKRLGMEVYGCDPFLSVEHAWNLSRDIKHVKTKEEIYKTCDFITVHVPLLEDTKQMINKDTMAMMKDGVVILNFARDLLVNDDDMEEALESKKVACYVTDFPNKKTAGMKGAIAIPHLGASTEESEDNCAIMAVKEVMNYLEHGTIKNSVNFPNCDAGVCESGIRITVNHKNIPNMLKQLTEVMSADNINIGNMVNKSKGDYAYTIIDIETTDTKSIEEKLNHINGVLKVRII
ncbi:MAG: D-isomer specific 2-hydroxyacid dehydrogenase NAD-binding [Anaerocolumna sp.]|jgi:D-3-phosphoglycerate dehydrogenase|nr:D-isomer specific 2-hydroxyacid dehydrogenase NAD-binding [Anaerocolumna sp.]